MEFLNSLGVSSAMFTSICITVLLCVTAIIAGRHLEMIPSGFQNVAETAIEKLYGFFSGVMGDYLCKRYFPIVGTLFIYILICNYSGLLPFAGHLSGFQAPTSDINFPAGMAILAFILVQAIGIREHRGLGTYKRMFKPFAVVFIFMLIDELVKPISLIFRLYGNTYGDEQVISAFFDICPLGLPVVMQLLVVLMALIQALVFSLLTAIYITEACEKDGRLE